MDGTLFKILNIGPHQILIFIAMCKLMMIKYSHIIMVSCYSIVQFEKNMRASDAISHFTKGCLYLVLLLISMYWGWSACLKITSPPIGTRLQFRYGDDNKGNLSLTAISICPDDFGYYKHSTGNTLRSNYFEFLFLSA